MTRYPHLFSLALFEVGAVALLFVISSVYHRTGRSESIAGAATAGAILLVGMALLATASYVVAAVTPLPLYDNALAAADRRLGFDWAEWMAWTQSRAWMSRSFEVAYDAMLPELVGAVLYLGFLRKSGWLLTTLFIGGALTALISGFFPAIGHLPSAPHVPVLRALRAGQLMDVMPQGLISFPSYHTTVAVLLTGAFRGSRFLFPMACVLNGVMVVSTLSVGGHYLVDVIAGVGVARIAHLIAQLNVRSMNR